ncbi:MAG: lysophospholipase [Gammaproteobacteria bacterium]
MLPARFTRLLAVLLLGLLVTACANRQLAELPTVPDEVITYAGDVVEDNFVNPDGLNIFGRYWLPVTPPRAAVVLVHGTIMHSGLYDEFGRYLAARGYVVYGIDLQGWGRSDGIGPRGDVYNYDKYVSDVALVIDRLRIEYPGIPVFGFGESLGGAVVLLGQVQRRSFFDGLLLSAPAFKPRPGFGVMRPPEIINDWGLSMAGWFGKKFPRMPTPIVANRLTMGIMVKDKEVARAMVRDPYVTHSLLPARYISALNEAIKFLQQHIEVINVPMLVIHGNKDILVPVSSSRELTTRTLSRDTTLAVYEGMHHAAMIQPHRYQAMMDFRRWLDLRTTPSATAYSGQTVPALRNSPQPACPEAVGC